MLLAFQNEKLKYIFFQKKGEVLLFMFKLNWKHLGLTVGLSLTLFAAGCGSNNDAGETNKDNDDKANQEVNIGKEVGYKIIGIEAGAGVVKATENALEEYDNLKGWKVDTSSSGAMATALGQAIKKEEPIIVTGWTPHWKFAKYDLKYLEDPKEVYGGEESIKTMVRKDLEKSAPNAYKILDNFHWTPEDMESVMLAREEGTSIEDAAKTWVKENEEKVNEWIDGIGQADGEEIELVYVEWDSEIASTNVIGEVLRQQGVKVKLTPLDNAIMWQSVANGEADGMVAAWLPATHGDLYEEYKDQLVDLGNNLEGAKIGMVVPAYVDIDSIEDLEPAK